jgi:hypothetical protein
MNHAALEAKHSESACSLAFWQRVVVAAVELVRASKRVRERETNFADDKQCIFAPQTSVAASDPPFLGLCDGSPAINAAIFLEKVLMPAALDKFFIAQTSLR